MSTRESRQLALNIAATPNVMQFCRFVEDPFRSAERLLSSFSCGATSAVATKLAIEANAGRLPVHVMYLETRSEHPDNERFLRDCERWFGVTVHRYGSQRYKDIWDVFERERFIAGVAGAKCTSVLKKHVAERVEKVTDLHVFGFHASAREKARAERMWRNQPEIMGWFPLIDAGVSKEDCFLMLAEAGIEIPAMYRLGFDNNNCVGCPKGGNAYWNRIRRHFPEVFARMSSISRDLGVQTIKITRNGKRVRAFLDELPLDAGDDQPVDMSCGLTCQQPEQGDLDA